MDEPPYSLEEVEALHHAFGEAMANAKEREATMPTSAECIRRRAANIRSVRDKLLGTMPHVDRRNYP